jgi:AraC-like DNA-binding protein
MDDVSNEMSVELSGPRLRFMLPTPNTPGPTRFKTLTANDIIALLSLDRYRNLIFYSDLTTAEAALMSLGTANERPDASAANKNGISRTDGQCRTHRATSRSPPLALQTWRLRRVQEYIRAHISDAIRLTDLANAAGLTRMYFAAQFRARTGVRPHEYVVRQRIARAQLLLKVPQTKISDVGFCVGFANQAHFTTVFRRYTGITPHRWRLSQYPEDWTVPMETSRFRAIARLSEPQYPSSEYRQSRSQHTAGD